MSKSNKPSSNLAKALEFVKGAAAKKDHVPELTHYLIRDGRITGYNGYYALSSPVGVDLEAAPSAVLFHRAVTVCGGDVELILDGNGTGDGWLRVESESVSVKIGCVPVTQWPTPAIVGDEVPLDGGLLDTLKRLAPFVGDDASRKWCCGILLDGKSAFATNNVVVIEAWHGHPLPERVNLPDHAVRELLRIGEEPAGVIITDNCARFTYPDGRWLQTQLYKTDWPDVRKVLEALDARGMGPVPTGLREALDVVASLSADKFSRCELLDGAVADLEGQVTVKADVVAGGKYWVPQLARVLEFAEKIKLSAYPNPVPFLSHRARGALLGLRL